MGFWRNAYVSFTSIYVIVIALFVIGATIFINELLNTALGNVQSRVDINVYFVVDAPQEGIDRIREAVSALPDVESVTYTSREDALAKYREANKNNEITMQALEELEDNPLGANLAILASETSRYGSIAGFLEEQKNSDQSQVPVIDYINYNQNKEAIDALTEIIGAVEQAGLVVMIALLIAATFITFNTISLAIYTSREEITIMRLVGAGNMFIRGPFMLQGMLYGLVAGVLSVLLFYPLLSWLGPRTQEFFEINLFDYYIVNFGEIFLILVGIGILLGLFSSILAIARYLRT